MTKTGADPRPFLPPEGEPPTGESRGGTPAAGTTAGMAEGPGRITGNRRSGPEAMDRGRRRKESTTMRGRAHVYPRAKITTDEIIPSRHLSADDESKLAAHALEGVDPDFAARVQ